MNYQKIINRYFLQFLFCRLTRNIYWKSDNYPLTRINFLKLKGFSSAPPGTEYNWYSLQYLILPFSGYGCDFKYLTKGPKYFNITKPKIKK